MKCPRDLSKKSDLVSLQENFAEVEIFELQLRTERKIFFRSFIVLPLCKCPIRKISLARSKKCEGKSSLRLPTEVILSVNPTFCIIPLYADRSPSIYQYLIYRYIRPQLIRPQKHLCSIIV